MKFLLFLVFIICYISNILAEPILANSKYCTQYNKTSIYLDSEKINALDNNQYIYKDFKNLDVDVKLDYYIRYAHISTGICYPKSSKDVKPTDEIGNFTIGEETKDLRYFKTVACYYLYHEYLDRSKPQDEDEILNRPCDNKIIEFYNNFHAFVHDENNCPPPSDSSKVSVGDKNAVNTARYNFLVGLYNLYSTTNQDPSCNSLNINSELIRNKYNDEIYFCGFPNSEMKANYCSKKRYKSLEPCCYYDLTTIFNEESERTYEIYTKPLIIGISSFVICFLIGIPLSYIYIKDIRTQESIMKAVYEQEKMYQLQSKRQQAEMHSVYSGYSTDPYRPHSNYSSISHQQIVPPSPQHSLPVAGNMSIHSLNNSQNRIIRSPQPLPASPAGDISNFNRPPSIQFAEISLPAPATTPSLSNTPRISSHGSSKHSSIDISDNFNLPPLDIPASPEISISPSTPDSSFMPVPERDESSLNRHDILSTPYRDESIDRTKSNTLTVPRRDESSRVRHERPSSNYSNPVSLTVPRRDESSKVKHDIVYHHNTTPSVPLRDESNKVKHDRPVSIKSNESIENNTKDETKDEVKVEVKDEAKTTTSTTETKDEVKDEAKTTTTTTENKDEVKVEVKDEAKTTTTTTETKDEAKDETKTTTTTTTETKDEDKK
ncbi:hypothetical protein BCR32DRAFT_265321 [Anaeromyces robustus]|jgi:hypothetical protein|uniref:Uncharacterized protein n=1 Tax=Anaeromyces robustus TaxID=1754192 RepID=A0A1Y1XJF1_9FUNG|nr:hypothetical protein BCR32DRAFT_265321 [Anaeromyces robustus]|eukprot:ORX85889.1 hypothetical protein BCR32DRAFT_265321 [Anaeromyces robustus]